MTKCYDEGKDFSCVLCIFLVLDLRRGCHPRGGGETEGNCVTECVCSVLQGRNGLCSVATVLTPANSAHGKTRVHNDLSLNVIVPSISNQQSFALITSQLLIIMEREIQI